MKTLLKIVFLSTLTFTLNACIITGVTGSRNVTTESREITESFSKLSVSQGIEVILTQEPKVSVTIEADDNLHELLKTEVENDVLRIYFSENVAQRKSSKVYLSMPELIGVTTSSGSEVNGQNTFEVEKITLNSSSGSQIDIRLNAQEISADSSSGSEITLKGACQFLIADSSSGSEINATELTAQDVRANASSGADIDVTSTENFTGNSSSGASISCDGNPKTKNIDKSSGGSVSVR